MSIPDNVRYLVADTETTGVNPDDKVVEIGWIEIDQNFNILDQFESLIDPERLIPPESSAVHNLVNADVENSPTIEEFFSSGSIGCLGYKIEYPVVLIGHRIAFDHGFLKPYITNVVQELCTLRFFRKLYPECGNHQLATSVYALNLPRSTGAHRVMGDVMTAYHLAKHICERTGMTLKELAAASAQPMLMRTMPMGKHKGDNISDVPSAYLRWMLGNLDMDFDLKYSVEFALNKKNNK